jgi:hypothetical protein
MTMLHLERAGTPELRRFYKDSLEKIRQRGSKVVEHIATQTLPPGSQYFKDIRFQLVHAMVQLEDRSTLEDFAAYSGWPDLWIREALNLLQEWGLVAEYSPGSWQSVVDFVHLDRSQPGYRDFHRAWRTFCDSQFLFRGAETSHDDFNLSSLIITDEAAARLIQERLISLIKDLAPKVDASAGKRLYYLGIDFMEFKRTI